MHTYSFPIEKVMQDACIFHIEGTIPFLSIQGWNQVAVLLSFQKSVPAIHFVNTVLRGKEKVYIFHI